ncbi:hypothetical protein Q5P01_000316 [Channa striata]|uniref:Uncharacterized protein n=1 Tax=Channa striata TaxID=64152 RepID=A0AA88IS37_CHASR|nr:hypothetical protein Q5P01_000316 [Channa striata]
MDRAHAVPGRVAGESERLDSVAPGSAAAAGPEPRRLSGRAVRQGLRTPRAATSPATLKLRSGGARPPEEKRRISARADGGRGGESDPSRNVFSAHRADRDRDGGPAAKFLEQLEWLKRRDEIAKQNALGKEISHQLASYSHTLEELEAPRYLSSHGPRWLYRMYGSLNRSRERARTLASPYPEARGDATRARLAAEGLRMALAATASTGTNDRCCPRGAWLRWTPRRRYRQAQRTAERVAAIQAPGGLGLVETPPSLLKSVSQARRGGMIGSLWPRGRAAAEKDRAAHGL